MGIFNSKNNDSAKSGQVVKHDGKTLSTNSILGKLVKQPRISEKSGLLAKQNKYAFVVQNYANKVQIKKAIESEYKVRVEKVNVINSLGKTVNAGRISGKRSDFKKAVVTLKKGDSINLGEVA